jgi:hypothetical protein
MSAAAAAMLLLAPKPTTAAYVEVDQTCLMSFCATPGSPAAEGLKPVCDKDNLAMMSVLRQMFFPRESSHIMLACCFVHGKVEGGELTRMEDRERTTTKNRK